MPAFIAGFDVGGTNVRTAIAEISEPTRFLSFRSSPTPTGLSPEAFVEFLYNEVSECLRQESLPDVDAVGCSTPGIVDSNTGSVLLASNLGWRHVPLGDLLTTKFSLPSVNENDVKAAAFAEYRYGAGQSRSSLVYLTVSTGVSAGIVVDGKVLRGHHHAAGEIAYFLPERAHIGQDWGVNGCLELNSAGVGLSAAFNRLQSLSEQPLTAAEIFALAREGHTDALELTQRAADYLAQAAVAIGTIIDPEILVLGGSIARNEPSIIDRIREVSAMVLPAPFEVALSSFEGDAPLIGALALAASLHEKTVRAAHSLVMNGNF